MTDTTTVRQVCEHDQYDEHRIRDRKGWPLEWCHGGQKLTLRRERPFDWNGLEDRWVWVEVTT